MLSRRSIFSFKKLASKAIIARAFSLQQVPQSPKQTSVLNDPDIQKWKQLHDEIEKEQMKAIQEKLTKGQLKNLHEIAEEVVDLNLFEMKGLCHYLEIRNKNDAQIAKNMNFFQNILAQSDIKKQQVEKDVTKMAQIPQIPLELVNKLLNPEIQDKLARALEIVSRSEAGLPAEAVQEAAPVKEEKKEEKKEKTSFNITLKAFKAENKIKVIKEVKAITGLGLKESKDKVEEVEKNPISLGQNVPKDKAAKIKQTLEELGCTVELT